MLTNRDLERNSAFELLRIVAQWMIVEYHLLYFYIFPTTGFLTYKVLQIPLHIGVVLYVLISGYYGIKPTPQKLFRLLLVIAVYTIPLMLIYDYGQDKPIVQTLKDILFVSRTPFWFVRTYLYLFMLAPILNYWLEDNKRSKYIIYVLAFISVYIGLMGKDPSLREGKNIFNFALVYAIGHELKGVVERKDRLSTVTVALGWILLNVIAMIICGLFSGQLVGKVTWTLSFPYNSPLLLINSILLFIMFGRMEFKSKIVNYIATSSFAIYLLHTHPFVRFELLPSLGLISIVPLSLVISTLLYITLFSLGIMAIAVLVDKCLTPVWKIADIRTTMLFKSSLIRIFK